MIFKEAEWPRFGIRTAHQSNRMFFLYFVFFVISVVFHFGFEGETVVLIKIVPGNSLLFMLNYHQQFSVDIICKLYIRSGKFKKTVILILVAYV